MQEIKVKLLSKEDIASILTLEDVIRITEEVYKHFGKGDIYAPPKISLPLQDPEVPGMHWINSMPAFLKYNEIVGVKWVNVTSNNRCVGLPVTMGSIILNDVKTGMPIAFLDGTWITHMRTGASIAIGAKYFARDDSKVMTVIGCGAEGGVGLEAMLKMIDCREIRAVDINKDVQSEFIREMTRKTDVKITPFESIQDAVETSDIVFLATTAEIPLVSRKWVKPGTFLATVSCFCDIDPEFAEGSDKLFLDETECALGRIKAMAGLSIPEDVVYGDICEVAAGIKKKRENADEIITYSPAGMGAVDVAVAYEALKIAKNKQLGQEFVLGNF